MVDVGRWRCVDVDAGVDVMAVCVCIWGYGVGFYVQVPHVRPYLPEC
jgi:hypothetical protein